MKKKIYLLLVTFFTGTFLNIGCSFEPIVTGTENTIEEEITDITDFSAIDLSHSYNAEVIQSDQYKIVIKYNSNLKDYLELKKDGKTLKIGLDKDHQYRNLKLAVRIYMPDLNSISASGACKIKFPGFNTSMLKISLSGASVINARFGIAEKLAIECSGASELNLEGSVKDASISFSGASTLKGKGFKVSNNLNIESSGASNITLTADGKISIELSGASEVNYYGNGSVVKSNSSGASTIKKIESDTVL
jgi:hypothetical protein